MEGVLASLRFSFAFFRVDERYRDPPCRDDAQTVGSDFNRSRNDSIRFRKADFSFEIFCVGTLLPTASQSSPAESAIRPRRDRKQHSLRSIHVAACGPRYYSQRPDTPSISETEICTKPLARRTLSRVRGRQVVWDDARARLQVIICVCA